MNFLLWRYTAATPTPVLLRHHRIARRIVYPCIFACAGTASSLVQIVLIGTGNGGAVVCLLFTAVALVLIVPAIFAIPILHEVEQAPTARREALPGRPINLRVRAWALGMTFWFVVAVAAPFLVRAIIAAL